MSSNAKRWYAAVVATCAAVAAAAPAWAQPPGSSRSGTTPQSAATLSLPNSPVWLGSVRLPARVKADGETLLPGTYRVRLTGEHAKEAEGGESPELERWVEFVQGSQVKARVLAPVVPASEVQAVAETSVPARGGVRAERLKGDDYYRVWFNYRGEQILIYLPLA